jgi:CRP-like cAMP-binding protein
MELNEKLSETKYQADDIVFNIGADAEVFYILKTGRMIIETIVEIEEYHKYPIGNQSWEILKTCRRLQYRLREIKSGTLFGYEEMLLGIKRRCRVRCLTTCDVIYLNKNDFNEYFPKNEVAKLRQDLKEVDLDKIVERIYRLNYDKKQQNTAILDATQVNPSNVFGGRSEAPDKKILRLYPWLEKARTNKTMSENILKQLERIKQLSITQDKVTINSWDVNYREQLERFSKKIARFVEAGEEEDEVDE